MGIKSFRIDDQTSEKFKEISNEISGNQQETMAKLIEAYEFQKGKMVLVEKRNDIDQFEKYISCLTNMYMRSLEDNQNITDTVRTEFQSQLQVKDNLISELQKKLEENKNVVAAATQEAKQEKQQSEILKAELERLKEMLKEKEKLNIALEDNCKDLKAKNEQLPHLEQELKDIKNNYHQISQEKAELEKELGSAALEKERMKLNLKEDYQNQLQEILKQKQEEIDDYQKKYFQLLEGKEKPAKKSRTSKETENP